MSIAMQAVTHDRQHFQTVAVPSKGRMAKLLAIINERSWYNMEEFTAHCQEFYKPSCGRISRACS